MGVVYIFEFRIKISRWPKKAENHYTLCILYYYTLIGNIFIYKNQRCNNYWGGSLRILCTTSRQHNNSILQGKSRTTRQTTGNVPNTVGAE
jgi:hypothetical protein